MAIPIYKRPGLAERSQQGLQQMTFLVCGHLCMMLSHLPTALWSSGTTSASSDQPPWTRSPSADSLSAAVHVVSSTTPQLCRAA